MKKQCTLDDCDRPHVARGLCHKHWSRKHGTHTTWIHNCATCGREVVKDYSPNRKRRATCSMICRHWLTYGAPALCRVPGTHPSRRAPKPEPMAPEFIRPPLTDRGCDWCGQTYMPRRHDHLYCTPMCKKRSSRVRRKGREADGHAYSWSQVIRVLLLLDGRCAYCDQVIEGPPDPDHVVPLSRGGSNGNANILPACRLCNSDKRDLLLYEWAEDRARRGKPEVCTVFDRSLPAFTHLLPDALRSSAA